MAQVKPTNKKKMTKPALAAMIVSIVILLGLVVSLVAGSGLFIRIQKGASSDNFDINGSMMSYYTNSYYQNWYQQNYYYILLGYLKFDPSTPLDQQYTDSNKTQTYYDYFVEGAKTTATTYLKYCEAAKADKDVNFDDLKAEAEKYADESIDSIKEAAKKNSMDLKTYIRQYFGEYVSKNDLRKALVLEHIASDYYEIIHERIHDGITEEREDKYFGDNLASYISAEYLVFTLSSTVVAEQVDEKNYELGKDDPAYKEALKAADEKAKILNEANKIKDKEFLDKLATAKTPDEFKTMLLEYKFETVFGTTYDAAVKNFATPDKPSADELKAYKESLIAIMDKFIAAVLEGKDDIETEANEPETADENTETTEETKWEKAKKTFTKSLVTNLKKVITDATKTSSYALKTDLDKFLFAGVKDQYGIDYAEGEEKGESAPVNDTFFEDKEITAETDKAIGKYTMSIYFVTEAAHRDETALRNVGHILFKVDANGTNGEYKTKDEAKAAAEKLYEEIKAQLVDGKISKEKFEEFGKVTHDANVFYDDVNKGDMVEEFEDWLFAATTEGEIGLVETTYGWHIMYYGGESGEIAWRFDAHEGATDADLEAWFEALPYDVDINNSIFDKIFG